MLSISADREEFTLAVARAAQGLPSRPVLPVHAGMLISTYSKPEMDDIVDLTAGDGDVTFTACLTAQVHAGGSVLLPGAMLREVSRYFTGKQVRIDWQGGSTARLTAGRTTFTFHAGDGEKYPSWPSPPEVTGKLDAQEFSGAVRKVVPAASRTVAHLSCVNLSMDDGRLTLACTDSSRLAVASPGFQVTLRQGEAPPSALAPAWVPERFAKVAGEGEVRLGWSENLITMMTPEVQVTSRLVSGQFPPWQEILAKMPGRWYQAVTASLVRAVKLADLAAGDGRIVLRFTPGGMLVSGEGAEGARCREHVDMAYQGQEMTLGAGARFLLDGLAGCGETAELAFGTGPLFIRGEGNYYCMIQPRRDMREEST